MSANTGHGHVRPRPDGVRARCGGPGICSECSRELAQLMQATSPIPKARANSQPIADIGSRETETGARASLPANEASPLGEAGGSGAVVRNAGGSHVAADHEPRIVIERAATGEEIATSDDPVAVALSAEGFRADDPMLSGDDLEIPGFLRRLQ